MITETSIFLIAIAHVLLGPDHYLPIVSVSALHKWSFKKTLLITILCIAVHLSLAILLSYATKKYILNTNSLFNLESVRLQIASWLLISSGVVYLLLGFRRSVGKKYNSNNSLPDNVLNNSKFNFIPKGILLLLFIIGPCEPMVMLFSAPGDSANLFSNILLFSVTTFFTVLTATMVFYFGLNRVERLKRIFNQPFGLASVFILSGISILLF